MAMMIRPAFGDLFRDTEARIAEMIYNITSLSPANLPLPQILGGLAVATVIFLWFTRR